MLFYYHLFPLQFSFFLEHLNVLKHKIKQRLNFLLDHSSTLEDFKIKAAALNLDVDFSGKWTTYKLLDEPQLKSTRSRTLDRSKSGKESQYNKYNIERIQERLSRNEGQFTIEDMFGSQQIQ